MIFSTLALVFKHSLAILTKLKLILRRGGEGGGGGRGEGRGEGRRGKYNRAMEQENAMEQESAT